MLQGTAEAAYFMLQRTTTFLPVVARLTTTNVAGALSFQVGMTGKGRMQSQVFTFAPPTTKNLVAKRTINQPIFGKTGVNRISLCTITTYTGRLVARSTAVRGKHLPGECRRSPDGPGYMTWLVSYTRQCDTASPEVSVSTSENK